MLLRVPQGRAVSGQVSEERRYLGERLQPLCLSYIEQEDTREVINISEVNAKLETLVAEGNELNAKIASIIKELGE